jgi:hypothetical protein
MALSVAALFREQSWGDCVNPRLSPQAANACGARVPECYSRRPSVSGELLMENRTNVVGSYFGSFCCLSRLRNFIRAL